MSAAAELIKSPRVAHHANEATDTDRGREAQSASRVNIGDPVL
jgi:hypothetical protein